MGSHAAEIIPQFIPGAQVESEENSEIERESIRADLVYRIQYMGKPHILNMELQTGSDSEMADRMLQYHVELYLDYHLPVLSVILYLFETSMPKPPFQEMSVEKALLTLEYQVIAVWKLEAEEYIRKKIVSMYTFLPAMKGATTSLLMQAVHEMEREYTRYQFGRHLVRFMRILQRSTSVSEQDKQHVMEELSMQYDSLIDDNPDVQKRITKGEQRGKIQGLQEVALLAVKGDYPDLAELAQERIERIQKLESLRELIRLIYKAPDEKTVRWLLETI
nr:hypothetical protein [Ktedonobacteraceae bacterium]